MEGAKERCVREAGDGGLNSAEDQAYQSLYLCGCTIRVESSHTCRLLS